MKTTTEKAVALLTGLVAALPWSSAAQAQATDSTSVSVSIRIAPIALIEFPDGFDFTIHVPDDKHGKGHDKRRGKGHDSHGNGNGYGHDKDGQRPVILPVLIPFKICGNALAAVSVSPDDFLRIPGGYYLGEAVKVSGDRHKNQKGEGHDKRRGKGHGDDGDDAVGYNVIVQFPMHSWQFASLRGWDGVGGAYRDDFASLPGQDGAGTPPLTADVSQHSNCAPGMIYIVTKHNWTVDGDNATHGDYRGSLEVTVTADER